jgi:adenylate cyclase
MRVGIFTGPVVGGSLGTAQRLIYTTIGDTVNVASRLESFDKDRVDPEFGDSPCRILIGQETLNYLDDQFVTKKIGSATLKGKDDEVVVYRVVGEAGKDPSAVVRPELDKPIGAGIGKLVGNKS